MRAFENASQFNVHRASFVEVGGDQNNYHHDQSLHVSGQNNNATYNNGPVHQGDYVNLGRNTGAIGVIATGRYHNIGPQAPQTLHSNTAPPAPIQGNRGNANPAGGNHNYYSDTHHRGDLVDLSYNSGPIGVIATGQNHNIGPQGPQSNGTRLKQSACEDTRVPQLLQPRPRQPETNSAPAVVTMSAVQSDQSTHQRDATLHMPQPPPQAPTRQVDDHTTAQNHASLGATDPLLCPKAASSTGSISGATLTSSPQLMQTTSTPAPLSRTSTPAPTGASPAVKESAAPEQRTEDTPVLSEFSELKLRPGHTLEPADQEKAKVNQKAKKNTCFLKRWFRKSPKKKATPETESET